MVIAYLRVTIDRQHLERQKDEITRYASANGWEISKWITDIVDGKEWRVSRLCSVYWTE